MGWETKATTTAVSQQEKHGKDGWTGSYLSHHSLFCIAPQTTMRNTKTVQKGTKQNP